MKGKRMCATILVVLMCFSGLAVITVGMDSEISMEPPFMGDGEEPTHSRSTEETTTPILEDSKLFPATQTISKTVKIPAGKQYYVWYDGTTKTLQGMQLPDYTAGLTPNALDALAKTPDWLDEDLAKKFGGLADIDINVICRSTPTFADVDGDEDLDLVVGEFGGTLKYYENADNALHYYEGEDFFIGAVYVEDTTLFSGIDVGTNSDPAFADLDNDGDEDLTIGAADGTLYYYRNDGGTWTYDASMYSGVFVSEYSTPAFADMDGDDDFEMTIGESDGTIT